MAPQPSHSFNPTSRGSETGFEEVRNHAERAGQLLPLSPNSRALTAFFSPRYRQTTAQLHFNSFNRSKCLKQIFARNRFSETPKQTPTEREHRRSCRFRCWITITLLLARGSRRAVNCDSDAIPCECEYYGQFPMLLLIINGP